MDARALSPAVVALAALSGCASLPHHEPAPFERPWVPQAVAIVVAPAFAHGGTTSPAMPGAAGGALVGGLGGALIAFQVAPLVLLLAGPQAIIAAPALGAIVGGAALAGALGGAAIGAGASAAADAAATVVTQLEPVLLRSELPADMARAVEAQIAAITPLRSEVVGDPVAIRHDDVIRDWLREHGYPAVIALRGPAMWFAQRAAPEPRYVMTLGADGSLVDTITGRTTALRGFLVESVPRSVDEWTRDDGAVARRERDALVRTLAERVVETFVLQAGVDTGKHAGTCGVLPRRPAVAWPYAKANVPRVESLTPLLAWDPWPKVPESLAPPGGATGFHYDLRVWKVAGDDVGELVVERFGLAQPEYRFEAPLAPAADYAWSVRVRYTVEGRARASRWSAVNGQYLPAGAVTGVLKYGAASGKDVVAKACEAEHIRPCGCLDFLPLPVLWRFATP